MNESCLSLKKDLREGPMQFFRNYVKNVRRLMKDNIDEIPDFTFVFDFRDNKLGNLLKPVSKSIGN